MDGNRRWSKKKGVDTFEGHRKSLENFENLMNEAKRLGIKCITVWAFSTENWKRSDEEVDFLFNLMPEFSKKYKKKFIKEEIRFVHLGRKDRVKKNIREILENFEEDTKNFSKHIVAVAVDYGGHDELIRAFEKMKEKGLEITEENIENSLDSSDLPRVDLIIRTAGEKRLSGFLSWQSAYSEIYFTKTYFPDFGPEELRKAVEDFSKRERKFGGDVLA